MTENAPTPLESFINYKADTGSQRINYSIDMFNDKGEKYEK